MKLGIGWTLALGIGFLVPAVGHAQEPDTPSLSTEDVLRAPESTTNVNAAVRAEKSAKAEAAATEAAAAPPAATPGYVKFVAPSGYVFDRPASWKKIDNLESKGAPSAFKYDAVFQDPQTGAVVSAVSVDSTQLGSVVDISDASAVNKLLTTMLNPTNAKSGVKIFRQTSGNGPQKSKWIRIKAQGTAQATNGNTVDTTFWVQIVQSNARLALVAVGYPSTQEKDASLPAFHTVRTLEIANVSGSAPAAAAGPDEPGPAKTKKNSAGGVRKQ